MCSSDMVKSPSVCLRLQICFVVSQPYPMGFQSSFPHTTCLPLPSLQNLKEIYSLYVDHVVKSPLHDPLDVEAKIENDAFTLALEKYAQSLPFFMSL